MNSIQASINASIQEVAAIANKIQSNYSYFDAFIVISGFDLMCYSSTILSFMLENLGKTVKVKFIQGYFYRRQFPNILFKK